jgi:hypothetical protein
MLLLNEQQIMENSLATQNQMTFKQFVLFNNIDLDTIMVDKIFHNIRNDIPIYMDESMIEYFGYSGNLKIQRKSLAQLIETNFIEYQNKLWHSYKNKEYIEFCENNQKSLKDFDLSFKNNEEKTEISSLYPPASTGKSASRIKHLLVMPKLFKEMLMLAQTDKGKQVRRYYIDMMEVMELYIKFQNQVQIKSLNVNIASLKTNLTEMKTMLSDQKTIMLDERKLNADERKLNADERKLRVEEEKRQADRYNNLFGKAVETKSILDTTNTNLQKILPERVRISKVPTIKNHVFVILKDTTDTDGFPYYALRRQEHSINNAIKKVKDKFPDVVVYLKIKHAGSIHFWNEVKVSTLKENIVHTDGTSNWFGIKDMTGSEFKKELKKLDKIKLNADE